MIINETYTIRIISSDNPSNFISSVEVTNTDLCTVTHDGFVITINTKDILGSADLVITDFEGKTVTIPIIVDSVEYTYTLEYDNNIIDVTKPAILFYNAENPIQHFFIKRIGFSKLNNRILTEKEMEEYGGDFTLDYQYDAKPNGISLSHDKVSITIEMLSAFSETNVTFIITSPDNSVFTIEVPIFVIEGSNILPDGDIVLDERDTTETLLYITGTDGPLEIISDSVGFHITNENDKILRLLPYAPNKAGSIITVNSLFNGITKTVTKNVYVKDFPLMINSKIKILEVGKAKEFLVENVIGDITLEGVLDTIDAFTYSVVYNRDTYTAIVSIIPTSPVGVSTINVIDTVPGRDLRIVTANVRFVKDIDLTVVTNNVKALDIPAVVRFTQATGTVKYMAVSKLTGLNIRCTIEYDVNPYNGKVSDSDGQIFVHAVMEDELVLRVADTRSFKDVDLTILSSGIDISKWTAIIPTAISQKDLSNNLTTPTQYSDVRLKAGDYVGNTWIKGYKYGINRINKITYKVSPPEDIKNNSTASLDWLKGLVDTTSTLNITIRDGFILEDINKNFTVTTKWVKENIFETVDLSTMGIIITDAQTVLYADNTHRITVTNVLDNTGVVIYLENGAESISARIDYEPVSFIDISPISLPKKIPMNKPSNCYDIKRIDPSVVNGEFKIYPSTKTDDSVTVLCEFGKNADGTDNIWTVIPEKSIKTFSDIVGKVVGAGGIELNVTSSSGIHPEFYPSALDSSNALSYLFLELPYKIRSFGYTLDTREVDDQAAGTFKILTDTSDIFHINGTANANTMLTRQGSTIAYNPELVSQNLGQVVSMPLGLEMYEHTENANGGTITPVEPSNRIILMNTGSALPYTLAETFLKELRFNSIYDPNEISTKIWIDSSSSGIDLTNLVTLSVNHIGRWIISDLGTELYEIPQKSTLEANTTLLISNTSSEVIEMEEFVNVFSIETEYNISDTQTTLIDLNEFINVKPYEFVYNISNTNTEIISANTDRSMNPGDFIANISFVAEEIIQLGINDITARVNIRENIDPLYHEYNVTLFSSKVNELNTNTVQFTVVRDDNFYNISRIDNSFLALEEFVKLSIQEHDKIISVIKSDNTVSEIQTVLALTADTMEVISDLDAYAYNIVEFVTLSNLQHDLVISNVVTEVSEVVTRTYFDSYHPINRLWRDATPMDISENDTRNYAIQDRSDIISSKEYLLVDISNIVTDSLSVEGHNPIYPAIVYQDGTVGDTYVGATAINFVNLGYNGLETDIVNQTNNNKSVINFFNTEFINVENDVLTQGNYDTLIHLDMLSLEYIGSETDIINQTNFETLIPISTVGLSYTGSETDIINQTNFDTLIPISTVGLSYTGSETDIISQHVDMVLSNSENLVDITNMAFDGEPNMNITSQTSTKAFMIDANTSIITDMSYESFIISQKSRIVMEIGEQSLTARDNTYICTQKAASKVVELGDTVKFHLPISYKPDTIVSVNINEFTTDSPASIVYTFTEENIRETNILDFSITGEVDDISINTFTGSNIETVETVSVV